MLCNRLWSYRTTVNRKCFPANVFCNHETFPPRTICNIQYSDIVITNTIIVTTLLKYRKLWLLGVCAYIFQRNVLLNLPFLLSACTYTEYCRKGLIYLSHIKCYRCQKWKFFVVKQTMTMRIDRPLAYSLT